MGLIAEWGCEMKVSKLKDRSKEILNLNNRRKNFDQKKKKKRQSHRDLSNSIKWSNIHVVRIPQDDKECGTKNKNKTVNYSCNSPKLVRNIN